MIALLIYSDVVYKSQAAERTADALLRHLLGVERANLPSQETAITTLLDLNSSQFSYGAVGKDLSNSGSYITHSGVNHIRNLHVGVRVTSTDRAVCRALVLVRDESYVADRVTAFKPMTSQVAKSIAVDGLIANLKYGSYPFNVKNLPADCRIKPDSGPPILTLS